MSAPSPVVIFVRPKNAGNIGALARVLSNFHVEELRLVGNPNVDAQEDAFENQDWALSCNGRYVLEAARWYPTLAEALEGVQISIGTSGRTEGFEKGFERPLRYPNEVFGDLRDRLQKTEDVRWALIMGTEDDGLSSEEAAQCQELIHIPTSERNPSMNIAMACGVLLYHWHLLRLGMLESGQTANPSGPRALFNNPQNLDSARSLRSGKNRWADQSHKEKWIEYLFQMLDETQFFKYPDREAVKARVRRWLQTFEIPIGELLFAFEILYQLKSWGEGQYGKRDFLKEDLGRLDNPQT